MCLKLINQIKCRESMGAIINKKKLLLRIKRVKENKTKLSVYRYIS